MGAEGVQLAGRDAELRAITAALRDRAGVHLLALEGSPGIGKTRLLEHVIGLARAGGATVLTSRASEFERELAFGVMRQLLRPILRAMPEPERDEVLTGTAALARPALELTPTTTIADPFAALDGLYWLIANLAERRPLVLCVDDLHWADELSARGIAYLLTRLEGVDAQLCVTLRPREPGSDVTALLEEILRAPQATIVRPAPLDDRAAARLVRSGLGEDADSAFCAACRAATGGNPLLLSELIRELREQGVAPTADAAHGVAAVVPRGLGTGVLRRVHRVSPAGETVAQAVAILDENAEPDHVAELAGLDAGETRSLLEALVAADILAAADPPRFSHPLVKAAVAASVPGRHRGRRHLTAAHLLERSGASAERLAVHLVEAPAAGDPWVATTLTAAAEQALARGAARSAGRLLRRALAEPPAPADRARVLLAAGQAEARGGDERAIAHLREAIEVAPDAETHGLAARMLIQLLGPAGQLRTGINLALAALERLPEHSDLWRQLEAEMLSLACLDRSTRGFGLQRVARLDRSMAGESPGACMLLAILANETLAQGASRTEAITVAERALAGGWLFGSVIMYAHASNTLMHAGRYAQAKGCWSDFIAHARARGDLVGVALAYSFRAAAHWRAGTLDDALADLELAAALLPTGVSALTEGFALAFRLEALVLRGELEVARSALAGATVPPEQLQAPILLSARGRLRLAEGRHREALADMRLVGELTTQWATTNSSLAPWRAEAALALNALGEAAEARAVIEEEISAAARWGDPWLLGQALRTRALVGPAAERHAGLADAVELLRNSEARLELAITLVEVGRIQIESGQRGEARGVLREALELAVESGSPAVAQRARDWLVAAGARPRRAAATGPAALTPTEQRVVRLAAGGSSNREIAQALFVTEKTIETHLASAYRKLSIRSRAQLADALGRRHD